VGITYVSKPVAVAAAITTAVDTPPPPQKNKRKSGNTRPLPLPFDLHQCGRLRIGHLLTVYGVSAPEFYKRAKAGLMPVADGRDPRPYWEAQTVIAFKAQQQQQQQQANGQAG